MSAVKTGAHSERPPLASLLAALRNDPNVEVRRQVAAELEQPPHENHGQVVYALGDALTDEDAQVRANAAHSLHRLAAHAGEALPRLTNALEDPNPAVRSEIAETLGDMGAIAASALEVLSLLRQDPDPSVRNIATKAMERIEPGSSERQFTQGPATSPDIPPVQVVIARLHNEGDPDVQVALVKHLGELGPEAAEAVPTLLTGLQAPYVPLREAICISLAQIGDLSAVTPLAGMLADAEVSVRAAAGIALSNFGAYAGVALPALIASGGDPAPEVRAAALQGIAAIAGAVNAAFHQALADENELIRNEAAEVLAALKG
jgi:hypothetical protein